jgi:hypothetical protein
MKERERGWIERKCWGSRMNNNLVLFRWGRVNQAGVFGSASLNEVGVHAHARTRTHTPPERERQTPLLESALAAN